MQQQQQQQQKANRFGLATKTVSIALLIVTCLAAVGSLFGIILALDSDLYSSNGEIDLVHSQPVQNAINNTVYDDVAAYLGYLHILKSDDDYSYRKQAASYESKLSQKSSNVLFKITDNEGKLFASNTDGELDSLSLVEVSFEYSTRGEAVRSTYYFETYDDATDFIDSYVYTKWHEYSFSGPYRCESTEDDGQATEESEIEQAEASEGEANSAPSSIIESVTSLDEDQTSISPEYKIYSEQNELTKYYVTATVRNISYETYKVSASINPSLPANDYIGSLVSLMSFINVMKYHFIYIFLIALLICVALTVFLCSAAGKRKGEVGVRANLIDKIPLDLLTAAYALVGVISAVIISDAVLGSYYRSNLIFNAILSLILLLVIGALLLSLILTFATRVKLGKWWRNSLIYKLYAFVKKYLLIFFSFVARCIRSINSLVKGLIFFGALFVTDMIYMMFMANGDEGLGLTVWFFRTGALLVLILLVSLDLNALRKGGKKISDGDLDAKINIKNLHGSYKEIGESFNNIGEGLSKAVQEQTKSERMKAELITNVSHDIKTPLTCIINYVDLLKKESLGSEQAKEYVDILDRQSMRLKKLTEDLVEASKASTGNISVNPENVKVSLLLSQAVGEYEEKLTARRISIINDCKSENAIVRCDGRLLWRVFDNLLSNIFKYAQESTRVYITTESEGGKVKITFKNISGYQLNISPDELTERFVRGDSSRNTEGSGLGLSIAKSLTELQGGSFNISIDGDLFKTTIIFDEVNED